MESTLLSRALRLLGYRGYSVAGLRRKLGEEAAAEEVELVLQQLLHWGYLNDKALARAYIRTHQVRWGTSRLTRKLREKGISEGDIEQAMVEAGSASDPCEVAMRLLQRHVSRHRWERQRALRFLYGRGFSLEVASQAWNSVQEFRDEVDKP